MEEKKLKIIYEAETVNTALDHALEKAINELCQGWEWIGSGYDFQTKERDLEFRSIKEW